MKSVITPTKREQRFFAHAKRMGDKSKHVKAKIGAVIVIGNYVVAKACNKMKSHPIQARYDRENNYHGCNARLHAEIGSLILSGRMDLSEAEIYISRHDKNGNLASCKPCVSCTQAIKDAGIKHVYYTHQEGYAYEKWGKRVP